MAQQVTSSDRFVVKDQNGNSIDYKAEENNESVYFGEKSTRFVHMIL